MKLNLTILFSIISIFISCNKNNDQIQIEGKYITATSGTLEPVVMYTMQGQVTNSSIIKDFYLRNRHYWIFNFDSTVISVKPKLMTLTILKDNKATVSLGTDTTSKKFEILNRSSSQFVVAEIGESSASFTDRRDRCDSLTLAVKSIVSDRMYTYINAGGIYINDVSYREMFPIEIKNGQLFLPIMVSLVRASKGTDYCINEEKSTFNSFNKNLIGNLQAGDTIAYQINKVQLIKQ